MDYFILRVCPNEQCQHTEQLMQIKTKKAAFDLSEQLTKEALEFCFLCDTTLQYNAKIVNHEEEQVAESTLEEVIIAFVQAQQGELLLKKRKGRRSDNWAIITQEVEEDYECYEKWFSNVATIYPEKEKGTVRVVTDTNFYPKEILHQMARHYKLDYVDWAYDQLEAPHWDAVFVLEEEKVGSFLEEIWDLKEIYVRNGYERNLDETHYYYSIHEETDAKGESVRVVRVVEQADWECFGYFVYEYYHGDSLPIQQVMQSLGVKTLEDSTFCTRHSFEEIEHVFLKHLYFEANEAFQTYMKK